MSTSEDSSECADSLLATIEETKGLERALKGLLQWQTGMKLECLDPLDMNKLHVATVGGLLKNGYLKVSFDGADGDTFCFPKDSSYLFPIGYCAENGLQVETPSARLTVVLTDCDVE